VGGLRNSAERLSTVHINGSKARAPLPRATCAIETTDSSNDGQRRFADAHRGDGRVAAFRAAAQGEKQLILFGIDGQHDGESFERVLESAAKASGQGTRRGRENLFRDSLELQRAMGAVADEVAVDAKRAGESNAGCAAETEIVLVGADAGDAGVERLDPVDLTRLRPSLRRLVPPKASVTEPSGISLQRLTLATESPVIRLTRTFDFRRFGDSRDNLWAMSVRSRFHLPPQAFCRNAIQGLSTGLDRLRVLVKNQNR
jgi:hypothetical protein